MLPALVDVDACLDGREFRAEDHRRHRSRQAAGYGGCDDGAHENHGARNKGLELLEALVADVGVAVGALGGITAGGVGGESPLSGQSLDR